MVSQIDFTTSLCAVGFVETAYRRVAHCVQPGYRECGAARQTRGFATDNPRPASFGGLFSYGFFWFHRSPLGGVPLSGCG